MVKWQKMSEWMADAIMLDASWFVETIEHKKSGKSMQTFALIGGFCYTRTVSIFN